MDGGVGGLINILLLKFNISIKKEMKKIKVQFFNVKKQQNATKVYVNIMQCSSL